MDEKTTDRNKIIANGKKHPAGMVSIGHPNTLAAMQHAGLVYRSVLEDWFLEDAAYGIQEN